MSSTAQASAFLYLVLHVTTWGKYSFSNGIPSLTYACVRREHLTTSLYQMSKHHQYSRAWGKKLSGVEWNGAEWSHGVESVL